MEAYKFILGVGTEDPYLALGYPPRYLTIGCRRFTKKTWDKIMKALNECKKGTPIKISASQTVRGRRLTYLYVLSKEGLSRFAYRDTRNEIVEISASDLRRIDKTWKAWLMEGQNGKTKRDTK